MPNPFGTVPVIACFCFGRGFPGDAAPGDPDDARREPGRLGHAGAARRTVDGRPGAGERRRPAQDRAHLPQVSPSQIHVHRVSRLSATSVGWGRRTEFFSGRANASGPSVSLPLRVVHIQYINLWRRKGWKIPLQWMILVLLFSGEQRKQNLVLTIQIGQNRLDFEKRLPHKSEKQRKNVDKCAIWFL